MSDNKELTQHNDFVQTIQEELPNLDKSALVQSGLSEKQNTSDDVLCN